MDFAHKATVSAYACLQGRGGAPEEEIIALTGAGAQLCSAEPTVSDPTCPTCNHRWISSYGWHALCHAGVEPHPTRVLSGPPDEGTLATLPPLARATLTLTKVSDVVLGEGALPPLLFRETSHDGWDGPTPQVALHRT